MMEPAGLFWLILTKGSLWLGLAWLGSHLWRRLGAAGRHLFWVLALVGLAFLPAAHSFLPSIDLAWLPRQAVVSQESWDGLEESARTAPAPVEMAATRIPGAARSTSLGDSAPAQSGWLGLLWGSISALLLIRLFAGFMRLRRLEAEATELRSVDLRALLAEADLEGRGIRFLVHGDVKTPCTWGVLSRGVLGRSASILSGPILRPVILLPKEVEHWSRGCLRDVVVHELAHVARRDWLSSQLARAVCALFFFQPLVWLAAARMAREAELACDDRVLSLGASAPDYAERLLGFARASRGAPASSALAMARSSDLSLRIAAILNPTLRRKAMTRSHLGIVLFIAVLLITLIGPSRLVHAGAEVRQSADEAPLVQAASEGDVAKIKALIADGEDVDLGVVGQGTPLIQAALNGHVSAVEALLAAGADVKAAEKSGPRSIPRTPLGAAAAGGDPQILQLLLDAGAHPEWAPRGDASPLMMAASGGHLQAVDLLLAAGADADRTISGDGSALIRAAGKGNTAVLKRLLAAGANADRTVRGDGSPLIRAAAAGDAEAVQLLLTAGADPNRGVRGDGTPLIVATRGGHQEVVELLLTAGARADLGSGGDGSPLIQAAGRGDRALVETLLDQGVDPDSSVDGDGSPLIRAAASGHSDVVELLLDRGASIDRVVPGDENALIQASWAGQLEVVELLVTRGADVNRRVTVEEARGVEVRTPLAMARRGGHQEVVDLLVRNSARD